MAEEATLLIQSSTALRRSHVGIALVVCAAANFACRASPQPNTTKQESPASAVAALPARADSPQLGALEIDASVSGYNLLWPSKRCCAFTLRVAADGSSVAQVVVSNSARPSERSEKSTVTPSEFLRLARVVDQADFFALPTSVGVTSIDGDIRKVRIRRGSQSHEVEIGESASDTANGAAEMRRAESVWQAVRSLVRIDEAVR
jgi:hypothetical protein